MRIVGYFPDIDFEDGTQFGRQVHVRMFVERMAERSDVDSAFYVGRGKDELAAANVTDTGPERNFLDRFRGECGRLFELARTVVQSEEPTTVYTRESPYFAPLVAVVLPGGRLVVETNDVPRDVRESVESFRQYVTLVTVRRLKWRFADHVIAVSEAVESFLRSEHGVTDLTVVENGVDSELFTPSEEIADSPPYEICYVGGFQRHQNLELMLRVVGQLDTPVEFKLVGGEPEDRERIASAAEEYGVRDLVDFVGRVPYENVPQYIHSSDLCFGPFEPEREASPLKVYEYLSCGREVVMVNDSGMESFERYPGVHRLQSDSPEALAERLDAVLGDVGFNRDGASLVRETRSWRAVVDQIVGVVKEAMGGEEE